VARVPRGRCQGGLIAQAAVRRLMTMWRRNRRSKRPKTYPSQQPSTSSNGGCQAQALFPLGVVKGGLPGCSTRSLASAAAKAQGKATLAASSARCPTSRCVHAEILCTKQRDIGPKSSGHVQSEPYRGKRLAGSQAQPIYQPCRKCLAYTGLSLSSGSSIGRSAAWKSASQAGSPQT